MLMQNAMLDTLCYCDVIATLTIHQLCKYIQINMYVYLKKKLLMVAKLASLTDVCDFTL